MWNKIKIRLTYSGIIILCGVMFSCRALSESELEKSMPGEQSTQEAQVEYSSSNNSSANDEIVKMYQEIIKIHEQAIEDAKLRINYGNGVVSELVDLEIDAAEIRIQLAEFQGDKETVIKELEKIVQSLTQKRKQLEREVNIGQRPLSGLNDFDIILLETKIRLAKIKLEGT